MNDRTLDINMDVMDDAAQQQLEHEEEQQEAEAASSLRNVLRDYDLGKIIEALGVSDVLDVISAHAIMDYVVYLVVKRTDQKEPWTRRQIFKREVLELAERINSE